MRKSYCFSWGPHQRARIWDYVFTHELPAFHRWRDRRHGKTGQSAVVLGDKHRTTEILSGHGVPMVPVLEMISPGADFDPSIRLTEYARLFLKPRCGSAGRGCFVVEKDEMDSGFRVFETHAGMATSRSTFDSLLKNFSKEPYLVQPLMRNHPALRELCETEDAVTVRMITELHEAKTVQCHSAMLEIPGPGKNLTHGKKSDVAGRFHVILAIDMATGEPMRLPEDRLPLAVREDYERVYAKMGRTGIPFWHELRKSALIAHSLFQDIYAVAWDYVVTPDGPFLLEGNTGWGTRMPQIITGGLISQTTR